jgi:NAD-dependent SIR2 family protein deacetylase
MTLHNQLQQAANLIAQADALVFSAGAGMGVDSGLPDFRGTNGFWKTFSVTTNKKMGITELASPQTFAEDPALAWWFYGRRLLSYRQTQPHAGFEILKRWGTSKHFGVWVFTSNVDGHFQKAGFQDARIEECHGSIHHLQCMKPCMPDIWPADEFVPEFDEVSGKLIGSLPLCPHCGGLARPNILMFSDYDFVDDRTQAQRKRRLAWLERVAFTGAKLVVIELGAGTVVPTVRHFSDQLTRNYGASIIRINPDDAQVWRGRHVGLAMPALNALSRINELCS